MSRIQLYSVGIIYLNICLSGCGTKDMKADQLPQKFLRCQTIFHA